uniref:CHCH domain-containing protein n=1 Tax=Anopheles atroparvus TaxID=41427 RepID=A0AAG5D878_ANOAO
MPRREYRSRTTPATPSKTPDTKNAPIASPANPAGSPTTHEPQTKATATNTPAGSGLFAQMAATAGGVAIGSALGRVVGGLFEGSETKDGKTDPAQPAGPTPVSTSPQPKLATHEECAWEVKQFLACVDNEVDMKVCEGFKEAMQQRKMEGLSGNPT